RPTGADRGLYPPRDALDRDDGVTLVIGVDLDPNIGPEHLPLCDVLGDRVEAGQRIGRDPRAQPLDDVAVVVVMRRLDQLDDKAALPHAASLARQSACNNALIAV